MASLHLWLNPPLRRWRWICLINSGKTNWSMQWWASSLFPQALGSKLLMGNMICSSSESLCLSTGPLIGQRNLIHQNFRINELIWLPKLKSHAQLSHYQKKKNRREREIMPLCTFSPPQPFQNPDGKKGSCCFFFYSLSHIQLFWDTMDYSPPGSSVHGISQARVLKGIAISFSRASFQPRDWSRMSHLALLFSHWVVYDAL